MLKKPELLAPAGDLNKLKTALAFGADAVYFGLPDFSLRVRINDFNWAKLKSGVKLAHQAGKKAYVTLNIFAHNYHLPKLVKHLKKLKEIGPDALFVSDPGVVATIKEIWPEANLSLSTQANCTNYQSARFWQSQGFKRVILSRELSMAEIAEVVKKTPGLEIETFVHGALCMAYSGRCFLSDLILGRGANLGDCVQPCRWEYEIKPLGHEQSFIIGQEEKGSYLMNSKDLCLIKRLPEIIASGVSALKIEGRAKSAYYIANVIGAYRRAIDLICAEKLSKKELETELEYLYQELATKLNHRGLTEGFMFRNEETMQNERNENYLANWEFSGQIVQVKPHGQGSRVLVQVHNTLKTSLSIEIIEPGYLVKQLELANFIDDKTKEIITEAHGGGGGQRVWLELDFIPANLSVLRCQTK